VKNAEHEVPDVIRRPASSWVASIVLHLVLGAGLLKLLTMPLPLDGLFGRQHAPSLPVERISFLALPKATGVPTTGRSGGDGRTERPRRPAPLVSPPAVPSTLPPPSTAQPDEGGSGPVIGQGGPTAGIRPSLGDPRLWVPPAAVIAAPKTDVERLDSSLVARLQAHKDSLALAYKPNKMERGDWTVEKNGKKYGLDPQFIHLGNFSLPTPLLALLPLNLKAQGNPIAQERDRRLNSMRTEILEQSQRVMNEEEFRTAVKRIRERKERERERMEKGGDQTVAAPSVTPRD
jgi:hypothetical protein